MFRGCTRECRFCQAGILYHGYRSRGLPSCACAAGLLHDVSKLLVLKAIISVMEKDKDTIRLTKIVVDEFLDALHTEYGARLLRKWNLPEIYCEICQEHHQTHYDTSNILLIALCCSRLSGVFSGVRFVISHISGILLNINTQIGRAHV